MGVVEKLQTLAKTELKIIRETTVTTNKTTGSPAPSGASMTAEQLVDALETAQKRSIQ